MEKPNLNEFVPVVEEVGKLQVVRDTTAVDNFISKCAETFSNLEVGKAFTVPKNFMSKLTLKKRLSAAVTVDEKVARLVFRIIKDKDGNVTGTKVCKLAPKAAKKESNDGETEEASNAV
jgi:hypothetical protein